MLGGNVDDKYGTKTKGKGKKKTALSTIVQVTSKKQKKQKQKMEQVGKSVGFRRGACCRAVKTVSGKKKY